MQFNRETQQAYKSQAYVKFGETLYLDRFLDSVNPEKKAQSKAIQTELTAARDRVQRLTQGKVRYPMFTLVIIVTLTPVAACAVRAGLREYR